MNIEEFARRVIELTPQIVKGFLRHEHNYLTRGEITLPQFWALDYLSHNEKCKMNSLAKHLRISPPATTGLIDRLIAQELVTRKDDLRDRRIVWIELTAKGKDVISSIRKQKIRALIKVFSKISSKDRGHYLNILEQIVKINDSFAYMKNQKQIKN
jgi:DNA-binding MarR family transcriptional regulator